MKILFLSANPRGSDKLNLAQEVKKIEDGLLRSKLRDQFEFVSKWEIDSDALRRALLEENPDVVHFSGHGGGQTGLVLVGQNGQPKPATGEALAGLFQQFPTIKCVVLNACFAEVQAQAIVQYVDYVVGMKEAVRDDAAIAFATGFYDGLGYGKPIEVAFELGRSAVQFEANSSGTTRQFIPLSSPEAEPMPAHLIPVLLRKPGSSTTKLTRSTLLPPQTPSVSEKLQAEDKATKARIYRDRVQQFYSNQDLSPLEKIQLAILANVLGLSEQEAQQIMQEEQKKQQLQPSTSSRSWFTRIGNAKKSLFACIAILAISGGVLASKQITENMSNGKFILNLRSAKCVDVKGDDNGSRLVLWDCKISALNSGDSSATNQTWILESDGSIRNGKSGKCIGVQGDDNGSPLVLWNCGRSGANRDNNLATDQKWDWETGGFIRNRKSRKCMDVRGGPGTSSGDLLQLWDCETSGKNLDNGSDTDQVWDLQGK